MLYRFFVFSFILFLSIMTYAQSPSEKQNFALIKAAEEGKTEQLIKILKNKPDIDSRDDNGGTALFYATQNHHLDIVKILVYNGANPDLSLYDGFTPLMSACVTGDFDIAEYLAASGAKLDEYNKYGATALHFAVAMGDYYISDMLLFYGADANKLTYEKTSPLLVAALYNDTAIARILLKKDANANTANKAGFSAFSVAINNNDTSLFDLLFANGADPKLLNKAPYKAAAWALKNHNEYAFKKLKPSQLGAEAFQNRRYNPLIIAYANNNMKLVKSLKKEGYSSGLLPFYSALLNQASFSFNTNDLFFNFGIGFQDVKYKSIIWINYGTRFKQKAVLLKDGEKSFTQLWEHRRYFELGLQKYFVIPLDNIELKPFLGLGAQFMMGHYDGLNQKLDTRFALVPKLGFYISIDPLFFSFSYEYTPYGLYDISPHKINLGIGYKINFTNKPKPYKLLWL